MKVVILCGGKGTRAYPFTDYFPKVLMPIAGTPILIHLMRSYAAQGFSDFVLSVGHRKEMLHDYFAGRFHEWHIEIVDTGIESDTGERIRRCHPYVTDTFFATYGDGLGNINFKALASFHAERGGLATLTSVPLRSQYGSVVFDDDQRVTRFDEKPLMTGYWINAGFFVFEKRVFEMWEGNNLEVEVLPRLAQRNVLYTYMHNGFWKSLDTSKDQQELESMYSGGHSPWLNVQATEHGDRRQAKEA